MKGIIEILQSVVAGGGGRNQVNSTVTQPQSSYFPSPPPLVINYDRSLNQDLDLPLICSDNCSWPWSRILSPCFSFSSVLHLPAVRDPFGIRNLFQLFNKTSKTYMEKSKDRNTTVRLRSGSCLGCGDQIKSPDVMPASDLLFTDQTKISVQVLFQRNDLRDWSLFIFQRGGGGEDFGSASQIFWKIYCK